MADNQTLLQKADVAIADVASGGGVLSTEQSKNFMRKLIDQPTMIKAARVVGMNSPTRQINKIGFGTRILKPGVSATALSSGDRSKPTFTKVDLTAKEVKAEVRIPYDVMEDTIERAQAATNEASNTGPGGLRQTILDLIAERAALDLEELALLGDTGSGDAYLALMNGYIKLADSNGNINDAAGAPISKTIFKNSKKALPTKYLRDIKSMKHYVSHNQETDYRDTLADRGTPMGDSYIQGYNPVMAYGSPVDPVALMPNSTGLFTNPLNLIFGVWRQISLEFDKDITAGVYIIVLSARIAVEIEEAEAIVETKNLA